MEKQNFVVLKNICKRFGSNTVIGNLDLEIKKAVWLRYLALLVAVKLPFYVWWLA